MSELPFEIPSNVDSIRKLFLDTRKQLVDTWEGLSEEVIIRRPGPHPEWSVKDIIAHICWWENFAIIRIAVLAAGLEITLVKDFDRLNAEVDAINASLPLDTVLAQFSVNQSLILNLIERLSFEEWANTNRPNFEGKTFLSLLGANTFGHYYEHLADLSAFKQGLM